GGPRIDVIKDLEKGVPSPWPRAFEAAKTSCGNLGLLFTLVLLLNPVPFSKLAPAVVISLIFLPFFPEGGLLLSAAFIAAIVLIRIGSAAVWGTIVGAALISA